MNATTDDSPTERWGAAVLAGCALTFIVTMALYVTVFGQPASDGVVTVADRAAHVLARWRFISALWVVEALAWGLLAVAAFTLQTRVAPALAWFPARAAWNSVGVGAVIQSLMYCFTLGGYPVAAAEADSIPALFAALRQASFILFYLGNAFVFLGLGAILFGEGRDSATLPRWVARIGGVVCLLVAFLLVALIAGFGSMMAVAPGALVGYLVTAWLGLAIWRRG